MTIGQSYWEFLMRNMRVANELPHWVQYLYPYLTWENINDLSVHLVSIDELEAKFPHGYHWNWSQYHTDSELWKAIRLVEESVKAIVGDKLPEGWALYCKMDEYAGELMVYETVELVDTICDEHHAIPHDFGLCVKEWLCYGESGTFQQDHSEKLTYTNAAGEKVEMEYGDVDTVISLPWTTQTDILQDRLNRNIDIQFVEKLLGKQLPIRLVSKGRDVYFVDGVDHWFEKHDGYRIAKACGEGELLQAKLRQFFNQQIKEVQNGVVDGIF